MYGDPILMLGQGDGGVCGLWGGRVSVCGGGVGSGDLCAEVCFGQW